VDRNSDGVGCHLAMLAGRKQSNILFRPAPWRQIFHCGTPGAVIAYPSKALANLQHAIG
jgi:hypothetical protein